VRIYRRHSETDWNTYVIVAIIELARTSANNPALPPWLEQPYHAAIKELAAIGASEILTEQDPETVRAILGVMAISRALGSRREF
jgi:hypothetical protein